MAFDAGNHAHAAGVTSVQITLTTSAATTLVIFAYLNDLNAGSAVSSITDNTGVTGAWTRRAFNSNGGTLEMWWAPASAAFTSKTFTVNLSGSSSYANVDILAFSGAASPSSPFDSNGSLPAGQSASGTDIVLSTTAANCDVFGAYRCNNDPATAGSGFALVTNAGHHFSMSEYKSVTSAQTNLTIASAGFADNAGIADAIALSGGGGGGARNNRMTTLGVG